MTKLHVYNHAVPSDFPSFFTHDLDDYSSNVMVQKNKEAKMLLFIYLVDSYGDTAPLQSLVHCPFDPAPCVIITEMEVIEKIGSVELDAEKVLEEYHLNSKKWGAEFYKAKLFAPHDLVEQTKMRRELEKRYNESLEAMRIQTRKDLEFWKEDAEKRTELYRDLHDENRKELKQFWKERFHAEMEMQREFLEMIGSLFHAKGTKSKKINMAGGFPPS